MSAADYPAFPILLVDDEKDILLSLQAILGMDGKNNSITCNDSRQVLDILSAREVEIIVLDLVMPHISGRELLEKVTRIYPEIPVIILTGTIDVDMAVQCMKVGAFDYVLKPVEEGRIINAVNHALSVRELKRENRSLRQHILSDTLEHPEIFSEIITKNKQMLSIFQYMESIAGSSQPVLITGETGVGKELIARAVHSLSNLKGPFTAVNVAGLDDQVFSDTLFGHARGAFTGADRARQGLVEQASGGTLFLDEIGDLSTASQTKLLRLIQEGEYFPLGMDKLRHANARIVASTNRDLWKLQEAETFRRDLFYRLGTHRIHVPPLRDRMEDIPLLIEHFLEMFSTSLNKQKPAIPEGLYPLLETQAFTGNVRELGAMVFDAVSSNISDVLKLESFKLQLTHTEGRHISQKKEAEGIHFFKSLNNLPTIKQCTKMLVNEAMNRSGNSQSIAASILGISHQALNQRLKNRPK